MRISSNTIFDSNVAALNQQQAKLFQTQQQIAGGKRILTAADDPVAAASAMDVSQSVAVNTQYTANRNAARSTLTMAEGALQGVTSLIQDVRDTAISAENGSLSSSTLQTIAADLTGKLQEMVGLANSTDGLGNYLFSGFQSRTQPFLATPAGVAFFGDDGQRNVQVSASQQVASSNSGADIFMRVKGGNGTFVTQAAPSNTGSGIISLGSVSNPALLTGNNYSVSFNVVGGVTTYDVTNTTTAAVVSTGNAYVSGQAISFDGMQFAVTGVPANGDVFTVTPSTNQSVFKTISDMINALNSPVVGANVANVMTHAINNLDNALNNVSNTSASLGLRINEIDSLQTMGDSLGLQLQTSLSQLQDTNYNQAASDLAQQQTILQAAQQSFAKVASLSLFNYL
jgi:flagellar hook-associated protein 3 FlgL